MTEINIEIKARCNHQDKIREMLLSRNARFAGTDHQIDTYFKVNHGRLKLREGNIENNLIHYFRNDMQGPKMSEFTLYKSGPDSSLKEILTRALGISIVVDKHREIYFIDNVKFHLDRVENLGTFVEIEAKGKDESMQDELIQQCNYYLQLFEISQDELISNSYSDLVGS